MAKTATATRAPDGASQAERNVTVWEWLVAIASGLIVLGSILYVFYLALTDDRSPPKIGIAIDRIVPTGNGYVVEFWVFNRGGTTAKNLSVEAELSRPGEPALVRSTTFTFVPDGSQRKGGLFFPVDPRQDRLRLYPVSFNYP